MKRQLFLIGPILILGFLFALTNSDSIKLFPTLSAQEKEKQTKEKKDDSKLIWYKYDEGMAKAKTDKKHVLINFYTDWCGFCKKMDNETFKNEKVRKLLNSSFVPVKVNANSSREVVMEGKKITEKELALRYYVRAYPVNWFLKSSGEKIGQVPGYIPAQEFANFLAFVKDDLFEKMTYDQYLKTKKKE